jgi:hypothetical protein
MGYDSLDLNPCYFHFWGTLEDIMYVSSPYSVQEIRDNIQREIFFCLKTDL